VGIVTAPTLGLATTRAITRSGGHQYTLVDGETTYGPYPGATALTGLQDSLGGSDGLMGYAVKMAMEEIERFGLHNITDQNWSEVRSRAFNAKNKARDLGSYVHGAVEQFNTESMLDKIGYETAPYLAQYGHAIYREGIKILNTEQYCVNTEVGFGGTYDSIVEIKGARGILDVKSGKEKASQRLQLTGLSMAQWHGLAGMEAEPMPALDPVGWILLLRPDGYQLVEHEITHLDREHFIGLVEMYHRIRGWAEQFAPTDREAA
jgi:hypothetical protein